MTKRNPTRRKTAQIRANPQAAILAGLNVLQVLEDQAPAYLDDVLHYGPGSFAGDGWAAVLVWYRRKGYHNYQSLTLFGVWAVAHDEETDLLIGSKPLTFSAPIYNPESYHQLIRRGFQTYYADDGSPPPSDSVACRIRYDAAQRLSLRQTVAAKLVEWLRKRRS